MVNQREIELDIPIPEYLFHNIVSINMVEIEEIYDGVLEKLSFDWFGSDEFESSSLVSSSNSSSCFMVNKDTVEFSLIFKNTIIK